MNRKVYISGPITGVDNLVVEYVFNKTEILLSSFGYIPVNPLKNGLPASATYEQHMKRDISLLLDCEYIYMVGVWKKSRGARLENQIADAVGIKLLKL
jgi:hypothetical protein